MYHKHWLDSPWSGFFEGKDPLKAGEVGVHEETLTHIGKRFSAGPPNAQDFIIHKAMTRILKSRLEMVNNRTWTPSFIRDPNAMASPKAQSTVRLLTISNRVFKILVIAL